MAVSEQRVQRPPAHEDLNADLQVLRRAGAGRARGLHLPALRQAAVMLDRCDDEDTEPAPILDVLREATGRLGGGLEQDAVEHLLGLARGMGLRESGERRQAAARFYNIQAETFRKRPERDLLSALADEVLALCHDARLRRTRLDMEQHRHPAESRLAVQWVERFEAYYRIWTPVYAMAADLEAALDTYTEEPSDRMPWQTEEGAAALRAEGQDSRFDPVAQARGYGRSALYWYAAFQLELKRFMSHHGGLWLASDADIEYQISDAVYRIGWHNPINDEDESWLRRQLADARREENDHFTDVILAFQRGITIHDLWQNHIHQGIPGASSEVARQNLSVWQAISACHEFCRTIDEDWLRIADWYRPGSSPRRGVDPLQMYRERIR